MSRSTEFVQTYWPFAQRMEKEYDVPALVAMAQSALETGWGDHAPGNMMFGMKCGKSWAGGKQLLTTTEYHKTDTKTYPQVISIEWIEAKGKYKYRVKDYFRKYPNPYESFADYAKVLRKLKRYAPAFEYTQDPERFAYEIWRGGYATDPNYPEKINAMMNIIKGKLPVKKKLKKPNIFLGGGLWNWEPFGKNYLK